MVCLLVYCQLVANEWVVREKNNLYIVYLPCYQLWVRSSVDDLYFFLAICPCIRLSIHLPSKQFSVLLYPSSIDCQFISIFFNCLQCLGKLAFCGGGLEIMSCHRLINPFFNYIVSTIVDLNLLAELTSKFVIEQSLQTSAQGLLISSWYFWNETSFILSPRLEQKLIGEFKANWF